jgi:hypothetical protein
LTKHDATDGARKHRSERDDQNASGQGGYGPELSLAPLGQGADETENSNKQEPKGQNHQGCLCLNRWAGGENSSGRKPKYGKDKSDFTGARKVLLHAQKSL